LILIRKVYVDALGTTTTYEQYLSSLFPTINFTVTPKADSKFKIVGAASVAAKVTRDCCLEGWYFEENEHASEISWSKELGSGYPSGAELCHLVLVCGKQIHYLFTRSQYPSVVERRYGSRFRFSKNCAFLMGNCESHLGK